MKKNRTNEPHEIDEFTTAMHPGDKPDDPALRLRNGHWHHPDAGWRKLDPDTDPSWPLCVACERQPCAVKLGGGYRQAVKRTCGSDLCRDRVRTAEQRAGKARRLAAGLEANVTATCPVCNEEFTYRRTQAREHCSRDCAGKSTFDRAVADLQGKPEAELNSTEWYKAYKSIQEWARTQVLKAVRRGQLVRPASCEECGKGGQIHGHHDDYNAPLTVRWLCGSCHSRWHHRHGPGKWPEGLTQPSRRNLGKAERARRLAEKRAAAKTGNDSAPQPDTDPGAPC